MQDTFPLEITHMRDERVPDGNHAINRA